MNINRSAIFTTLAVFLSALGISSCKDPPLSISREECLSVSTDNDYAFDEMASYIERKTRWTATRDGGEGGCKPTLYASVIVISVERNVHVLFSTHAERVGYSALVAINEPARGRVFASGLGVSESFEEAVELASESAFRTNYDIQ